MENLITTTLVLHFCFLSFDPRRCKQPKEQARFPVSWNLTSYYRWLGCFAEWVGSLASYTSQKITAYIFLGCHVLALDLVKSWSFDRPHMMVLDAPARTNKKENARPTSSISRRSMFDHAMRRRSTILIDMQIPSLPPTRPTSPPLQANGVPKIEEEHYSNDRDSVARKVGLGNLMKSARQDIQVPEFDMNSFF